MWYVWYIEQWQWRERGGDSVASALNVAAAAVNGGIALSGGVIKMAASASAGVSSKRMKNSMASRRSGIVKAAASRGKRGSIKAW